MAKKINVKLILKLYSAHMSVNQIVSTRHMSKNSVCDVLRIANELGITYETIKDKEDLEVYHLFYPDKHTIENLYKLPDYEHIHKELKRVGVTLKLLHQEYVDACNMDDSVSMGYVKFCNGYKQYTIASKVTSHITHKPGIITEVDWSGPTMSYTNGLTGIHCYILA